MSDLDAVIVWFRDDLRLCDHPAFHDAAASGRPVVPLYVLEPGLGGAARWWLHHSLVRLATSLRALGCRLILRQGDPALVVPMVAREAGAGTVHLTRRFDPKGVAIDRLTVAALEGSGVKVRAFKGALLQRPEDVRTQGGDPFRVFTPFWRQVRSQDPGTPLAAPRTVHPYQGELKSDRAEDWGLLPTRPDWAGGLRENWVPGEAAAQRDLADFVDGRLDRYDRERNFPDSDAVSRLSPRLRWGELSPRQIWHAALTRSDGREAATEKFLAELGWREFSYHLLVAEPGLPDQPLRPEFGRFPWQPDPQLLEAWQQGRTGYALVDAGMRELWHTGWMHNRVRMVVASFLVKHLLQPWQSGADWFLDTLVDADIAANSQNWQWVTGCGADAAPYFRVFNPTLQAKKFDPHGRYIRRWVPERRSLADDDVGEPIAPIIEHDVARARALAAFETVKRSAA